MSLQTADRELEIIQEIGVYCWCLNPPRYREATDVSCVWVFIGKPAKGRFVGKTNSGASSPRQTGAIYMRNSNQQVGRQKKTSFVHWINSCHIFVVFLTFFLSGPSSVEELDSCVHCEQYSQLLAVMWLSGVQVQVEQRISYYAKLCI